MEGEEDKAFHELELVEEMMKVVVSWKTEMMIMSSFSLSGLCTILVNTFSCELILSFLFSNTLFSYKTLY